MDPRINQIYSVRGQLWRVVLVKPSYIIAERLGDSMGTTFTKDYWLTNAKFGAVAWAITTSDGSYVLSEQEPPAGTLGARMVQVIEL